MNAKTDNRWDLGDCSVTLIKGGRLKLDGGAMFGIIPKALWARACPADDQNRITLDCNCLLVEWPQNPERRLIIETGHGNKYGAKEQKIFAINPAYWLLPALQTHGIDPAGITDVVLSHLHFDHAGGLTYERDGATVLTFEQARVHVQRQEYNDAHNHAGIMTATYRAENYTAIDEADAWNLVDGAAVIAPGVRVLPTCGHTRGHQAVVVEGSQRALAFAGDLMPTRHHLGRPYNMAYDLLPLDNRESKHQLLEWLAECDGLLALDHEVQTPIMRVHKSGDWFKLEPA